jgi:hypothetical protein
MDPFTLSAVSLGINAASAGASWWLGNQRADMQRAETDESVRRFQLDRERILGRARAGGAASGVAFESSSLQGYLKTMTDEFQRQAEWMRRAGYAGADITRTSATLGFVGDLGSSVFRFGAANNWWKS